MDERGKAITERVRLDDGSRAARPSTAFHVRVDRYLDPATANRQAVCLQSVAAEVRTLADCTAGLLLRPSYDPITRTVSFYQETATSRLAPDTFYRLTVLTADEDTGDFGLRAFDGAALEGNYVLDFKTEVDEPSHPTESPPEGALDCGTDACLARCASLPAGTDPEGNPETDDALAARRGACARSCAILRGPLSSCGAGGCHSATSRAPAMGLDLSSGGSIEATARARIAHQTQRGPQATTGDQSSLTFGRSMPIIAPGDPGRSYLLYKLLASSPPADDLAEGEADRLRAGVVVGLPMPPTGYAPPSQEHLEDLSAWIAAGATFSDCR